jgi:hypothetical protein
MFTAHTLTNYSNPQTMRHANSPYPNAVTQKKYIYIWSHIFCIGERSHEKNQLQSI